MTNRKYPTYPTKLKIAIDNGGRCAFCGIDSEKLYPNLQGEKLGSVRVGKFAHIHSESENGPRYDVKISDEPMEAGEVLGITGWYIMLQIVLGGVLLMIVFVISCKLKD